MGALLVEGMDAKPEGLSMFHGRLAQIRDKCIAIAVAWDVGLQVFQSLLKPSVTEGSFEPLTPVLLDRDQFHRYDSELVRALNNNEVLNVALTGGYGAGKSSVIKSFFARHPEFETAYVSLATFSKDAPSPLPVSDQEHSSEGTGAIGQAADSSQASALPNDLITRIEETIVQQLLYTVPASRLPKTRLKRIVQARKWTILRRTVVMAALLLGSLRLYVPTIEKPPKLDPDWLLPSLMLIPGWLAVFGVGLGCCYVLHACLNFLSMFSIDGLTIKGGKLEATNHGSVLHKNVDEIIYCFERSDIRVVVIEDLDRFGTQEVFFRLREINFTIRHSPEIKRPVHFIYAIRDELFTVTDKTKFFDLIIPVIPVVNSENSREKLNLLMAARTINGTQLGSTLDPILVETICYYIDEMRLIKNIVNEYDIFANLLSHGGLDLDQNKLFAMVVFRNLYPEEYAELSKRRGKVYGVLTGLSKWLDIADKEFVAKLEELREGKVERLLFGEEQMLDARLRVWHEALKASGINDANYILSDGHQRFSLTEFLKDEIFEQLCQAGQWQGSAHTQYSHYNSQGHALKPRDILAQADFDKRVSRIQTPMKEIEDAIRSAERDITRVKTLSFRDAARGDYGSVIEQQLPGMDAIVYLLRAGYLENDYTDYLGFFYEGSLTHDDQNLLLALRRRALPDVASPIRNPQRVISKLEHGSLDGGGGIIASLIAELSISANLHDFSDVRTQKLVVILNSASGHLGRFADAARIILAGPTRTSFIQAVFSVEPLLHSLLLTTEQFTASDDRRDLICGLLDTLSTEQMEQMPGKEVLLNTAEELPNVDTLIPGMQTEANGWAWLIHEPARFRNLDPATEDQILRSLVEWGCLAPNLQMMKLLCRRLDGGDGMVSYRRLRALNVRGLNSLIETSPEDFLHGLMQQSGTWEEDARALQYILSLVVDDPNFQNQVFGRTRCQIEDLSGFSDNIWIEALRLDRVASVATAGRAFYMHMLVRPEEPPADSPSDDERAHLESVFDEFIVRNVTAAGNLWDENSPDDDSLKLHFILSEHFDDALLEQIFAKTTVGASVVEGADLSESGWLYLVNAPFVPFDTQTQKVFGTESFDLEIQYLARRWGVAREELELLRLDPHIVVGLGKSPSVPIVDVIKMWEGLVERGVAEDSATLEYLPYVCAKANAKGLTLSPNCLPIIVRVANDTSTTKEDRKELLVQALRLDCDWVTAVPILILMADGYEDLAAKKRSAHLPLSDLDERVAQALQFGGFVGKVKPGKVSMEAFSRTSGMI